VPPQFAAPVTSLVDPTTSSSLSSGKLSPSLVPLPALLMSSTSPAPPSLELAPLRLTAAAAEEVATATAAAPNRRRSQRSRSAWAAALLLAASAELARPAAARAAAAACSTRALLSRIGRFRSGRSLPPPVAAPPASPDAAPPTLERSWLRRAAAAWTAVVWARTAVADPKHGRRLSAAPRRPGTDWAAILVGSKAARAPPPGTPPRAPPLVEPPADGDAPTAAAAAPKLSATVSWAIARASVAWTGPVNPSATGRLQAKAAAGGSTTHLKDGARCTADAVSDAAAELVEAAEEA